MIDFELTKSTLAQNVAKLLQQIQGPLDYVSAIEKIYANAGNLLPQNVLDVKRKLSSGVSDVEAFPQYLEAAAKSITDHTNYRNYAPPRGDLTARIALAIQESIKLDKIDAYTSDDICLTEGGTGAISSIIETIADAFPEAEILIPCPSYYVFKLCAQQQRLKIVEVQPNVKTAASGNLSLMDDIIGSISANTKLIVITQPSNPAGEVYTNDELTRLLIVAAKKDIFIIFDELFSDLIIDHEARFYPGDLVASNVQALDKVVCVKAYSKSRNLPGFRIGYAYSKNKWLMNALEKQQEQRVFSASGSNFKELILLESFYRTVEDINRYSPNAHAINEAYEHFQAHRIMLPFPIDVAAAKFNEYADYTADVLRFYAENYELVQSTLKDMADNASRTQAAFNTLLHIPSLDTVNQFDFSVNLFIHTGVKIQLGPYFGMDQRTWQDEFGFWLRVSFSMQPEYLKEAMQKFERFALDYVDNPQRYVKFGYDF